MVLGALLRKARVGAGRLRARRPLEAGRVPPRRRPAARARRRARRRHELQRRHQRGPPFDDSARPLGALAPPVPDQSGVRRRARPHPRARRHRALVRSLRSPDQRHPQRAAPGASPEDARRRLVQPLNPCVRGCFVYKPFHAQPVPRGAPAVPEDRPPVLREGARAARRRVGARQHLPELGLQARRRARHPRRALPRGGRRRAAATTGSASPRARSSRAA